MRSHRLASWKRRTGTHAVRAIKSLSVACLLLAGAAGAEAQQAGASVKPKIYISVDMEGIGALVKEQFGPADFDYQSGRRLMTAQVNAAVEGCLEAGAGEVVVSDSHGNAQNLIPEELNEAAILIRGFPRSLMQMEGIDASFAGAIFIGYHPREGTPQANISHTLWGRKLQEIRVNGRAVSESMFNAAVAGSLGVPVILVTGDQHITREAVETFGPVETVVAKESIGYYAAKARHPRLVCREIQEKSRRAVERIKELKPFVIAPPLTMEVTFKSTIDAESFGYLPWVKRTGKTVAVEAKTMTDLNRFLAALFSINAN